MIMKTLDLAGYKKVYLTVTLPVYDTIHVETPSKELYSEMIALSPEFNRINDGFNSGSETARADAISMFNGLYGLVASILSRNLEKVTVSVEYLDEHFDADTVLKIFASYLDFTTETANARIKN